MEVSKEEFLQWKESPVTKAVYDVIEDRILDAQSILAMTAGEDPVADRLLVGMIRAFNELKEVSYDD